MNQENNNSFIESDQINLGRFLRIILLQSKIIFFTSFAGLILSLSIYLLTSNTYQISSLLQVNSPVQSFDPRKSLNLDFFNATETNLNNLITLYSSRSNMIELINDLNLNLKLKKLDENENLNMNVFLFKKAEESEKKLFFLKFQDDFYSLLDDQNNVLITGENGKFFKNDNFEIQISFSNISSEKLVEIHYVNPSNLYNFYKKQLRVNKTGPVSINWSQEGLIKVSYITDNVAKGKRIIDRANEIFIKDNIKVETEKARTSIAFIDSQLSTLEEVLNLRKTDLRNFKQENRSLNVNLEVQSIIDLIADIEKKINKVDLELSQAEINFTSDNPLFINLKIQKEALENQKNSIEQEIETLPFAQQEYIDLFRNLQISEELYSELVNRRLNFSIVEASSIGNIRVVDRAFIESFIGPRLSSIFFITLFFFFVGIVVAIFRGIFFISITNPAELKDAGINEKITGVIPHLEEIDNPFGDNRFQQSIETTILNLETIFASFENNEKNIICRKVVITSPTPENGKSFVSRNIAEGLARIGNKVLLIDADLKRGSQHKVFNKETIEISTFKNISLENIENFKVGNNLYLLPRLKKIKNTFEHLYSNSFLDKINQLENFFDYIIIDTAPALSVSDTGLLMTFSDVNFLVIRHGVNRINEVKQTNQIIDQIGRTFEGFIYNDYQKPKGYYGYYNIYGDYSYRYYAERYLYDSYYEADND